MRTLCLLALVGLGTPVLAQDAASSSQAAAGIDEVVVPGRRPENLRVEIERLEGAVYERWNALNSTDEFDIHCSERLPTGTNIPVRTCVPNFVIEAESRAAKDRVVDARSSAARRDHAESTASLERKSRELTEEMQRLARQDEQLLRDLVRLDELRQLQANEQRERRAGR